MAEFKPMVKMMTTEPSVILKLKKGGHVGMKGGKGDSGHKKMADGGMMDSLDRGSMGARPAMSVSPLARAMAARKKKPMIAPPRMKEGGETKSMHKAEMSKMSKIEKELKSHEGKPASKGHMGLKTGGIAKSTKPGGYKTGGVVNGQGGFKDGGIIKTMTNKTTKVVGAKPDNNSAPTGDVKMGNAGGYKKGGAAKKHYATGGVVDSGRPVAMPQGAKKPSSPVAINQLSGTFKKGGTVTSTEKRLQKTFETENAPAMRAAKATTEDVYSKYQTGKKRGGVVC
jgi:hypothetical protein